MLVARLIEGKEIFELGKVDSIQTGNLNYAGCRTVSAKATGKDVVVNVKSYEDRNGNLYSPVNHIRYLVNEQIQLAQMATV